MKDLFLSIVNIFRYTGKFFTVIRNLLFNLLMIAVFIGFLLSLGGPKKAEIPSKSILSVDLVGKIVEEPSDTTGLEHYINTGLMGESKREETVLQDIVDAITAAETDQRIVALLLHLEDLQKAGLDQLRTIGRSLEHFKQSGKKIYVAEDFYSQSQYYLASYADTVIMNPMGAIDLHGFGVYRLYYKDALDKLKVNYNIFRVGEYKSALEPFLRNDMSVEDREQTQQWLTSLWTLFREDIAKQRNIQPTDIDSYTNNIDQLLQTSNGDTAQAAVANKFVDKLMTRAELRTFLAGLTDSPSQKPQTVSTESYLNYLDDRQSSEKQSVHQKIGLIFAEGSILPGRQAAGLIGSDSLADLLQDARKDSSIKAVVLRINSPGGSAFASELIRQEILETRKAGKPVVVSMASMAASGGYWIASAADAIWASPATITGSIGIFGAIPTFENSLAKLGIYGDGTGTTPIASGFSVTLPLPVKLQRSIQLGVENGYNQFISVVAEGREMSMEDVQKIAHGRVYDGSTARKLGLVDELGSLDDAVKNAAKLVRLDNYEIEPLAPKRGVKERLVHLLSQSKFSTSALFKNAVLKDLQQLLHSQLIDLDALQDPRGIYAHSLIQMNM